MATRRSVGSRASRFLHPPWRRRESRAALAPALVRVSKRLRKRTAATGLGQRDGTPLPAAAAACGCRCRCLCRCRCPVATVTRGAACCRRSSICRRVGRGGGHGDGLWGRLAPALPVCQWKGPAWHAATVLRRPLQRPSCQVSHTRQRPSGRRERTRHVEGGVTISNPAGKAVRQQVGQPLPSFRGQSAHGNAALPQACVLQQSKAHQDCRPAATIRTW